jgi:hypothetical protein
MTVLKYVFTILLIMFIVPFRSVAEEPSMFLCLDSMMHLKSSTGKDPQKLVYGYIDGKKTPCMTEYEFRVKYSQDSFNRTKTNDTSSSVKKAKRETIYRGDKKLANADLRGLDLQGIDLSGADLKNAQLESADLRRANLRNANLSGANLENAYCKNADLNGANIIDAQISGAYFHNANLRNVKGLTVENLRTVATLYNVQLEKPILEIIENKYPSKMRNPKNSWKQKIYSSDEEIPLSERADPEMFH